MRLGVDWYPEQHPPERWPDDVRRMVGAGLELVRLGEFAWASIEPSRDRFEWAWLDRAIEIAAGAGLRVVLGTPTAVPPVWLCEERPEILLVASDGHRSAFGSRKFTCPTVAAYREESRRIVESLVARYGDHPGIVAWQIDNEPGNHESVWCWCEACEAGFRDWLRARYGSIEALNEAWGTVFWSGTYPSFDSIRLPRPTPADHSPSLLLAHRRFASGQVVDSVEDQRSIIAAGAPGREIFSNMPADEGNVDQRAIARLVGAAAIDLYPHGHGGGHDVPYLLDLARGHTGRAWVMEHQPGPINWTPTAAPVPPGQIRLWGWDVALHGHEALLFFSWRSTRSGSEQYHTGLVRHDGADDRGLGEVARLAAELRAADPVRLARPPATIAILSSVEDHWAIQLDPHRPGLTHQELVVNAHAAARRVGLETDVVDPAGDLTPYRAVLAPALQLATPDRLAALRRAIEGGTLVVLGVRSLVKDADDCWVEEPLPAGLAESLGSVVTDSFAGDDRITVSVAGSGGVPGVSLPAGPWVDVLAEPEADSGAEVIARFASGWLDGMPAAIRLGALAYAGSSSVEAWVALLRALLAERAPLVDVPSGRERFVRGDRVIELDHDRLTVEGLGLADSAGPRRRDVPQSATTPAPSTGSTT